MSVLFFIIAISCANNSKTIEQDKIIPDTSNNSGKITEIVEQDLNGCYMKIIERDTAVLMLHQKGNELSGKMIYDNYQKDGSNGTVKGKEEAGL